MNNLINYQGGIFNKGYVRAYARYVGIDEDVGHRSCKRQINFLTTCMARQIIVSSRNLGRNRGGIALLVHRKKVYRRDDAADLPNAWDVSRTL